MGQDGRRQGDVRLTLDHDEAVQVFANLTAEQYDLAVRAHMNAQRVVIRGILNRGPRLSVVSGVESFELLDQARLGVRFT